MQALMRIVLVFLVINSMAGACESDRFGVVLLDWASRMPVAGVELQSDAFDGSFVTNDRGKACLPFAFREHARYSHQDYGGAQLALDKPIEGDLVRLIERTSSRSIALVDEEGNSIQGSVLIVLNAAETEWVETGPGGRLTLADRTAGVPVAAVAPGYSINCALGEADQVAVALSRPSSVQVAVASGVEDLSASWTLDDALPWCPQVVLDDAKFAPKSTQLDDRTWRIDSLVPGSGLLTIRAGTAEATVGPIVLLPGNVVEIPELHWSSVKRLLGRTVSPSGVVLSDIRVGLFRAGISDAITLVRSGDEGKFEVTVPKEDATGVLIGGTPPGPTSEPLSASSRQPLVIVVPAATSISGTVRSDADDPVVGAVIEARPLERGSAFRGGRGVTVKSDDSGRYEIVGLAAGEWRLDVRHDDFAPSILAPVSTSERARVTQPVVLSRGAVIHGQVVSGRDKVPVLGAEVWVVSSSESLRKTWTDHDGEFTLSGAPFGTVQVQARGPNGSTAGAAVDAMDGKVELLLRPAASVEGQVLDELRRPIEGLTIEVQGTSLGVTTDVGGEYRIDGIRPGRRRVILKRRSLGGHQLLEAREVTLEPGDTATVDFDGGFVVRGSVLINDEPARNTQIRFSRMNEGHPSGNPGDLLVSSITDDFGLFELDGVRSGTYTVHIATSVFDYFKSIDVSSENSDNIVISVDGSIVGARIVDGDSGEPVVGARLELFDPRYSFGAVTSYWSPHRASVQVAGQTISALSDLDGWLTLFAERGDHRIRVSADGYQRLESDVRVDSETNDLGEFAIQPKEALRGIVRDSWGGSIAGAQVLASCAGSRETFFTSSDPEGMFRVEVSSADSCVLVGRLGERGVGFLEGAKGDWIDLTIRPAGSLKLMVSAEEPGDVLEIRTAGGYTLTSLMGLRALDPPELHQLDERSLEMHYSLIPAGEYSVFDQKTGTRIAIVVDENDVTVVDLRH